jgi:hypothetical protein
VSAISDAFPVVQAFDEEVIGKGFRPAQMVLLAFLVMFGCVRGYAHLVRRGRGFGNLTLGATRIHHLVPGVFLLLIAGFVSIGLDPEMPWWLWWLLPTMFGCGAALVLDEYALWLNLRDVYWAEEGRRSIDAVIVAAALAGMVALGAPFWGRVISGADPAGGASIVAYHAVSVVSAVVCLLKGKLSVGVIGFLLWPVGLVGAIRLAEPNSVWARHLYDAEKLRRARGRYPDHVAPGGTPNEPATRVSVEA